MICFDTVDDYENRLRAEFELVLSVAAIIIVSNFVSQCLFSSEWS